MQDLLVAIYPWAKALHIMAVISWMAGIFYLPRLFVYHAERAKDGGELADTLVIMELKLFRVIMNPAMIATWVFGLLLVMTPGVIDWGSGWVWVKAVLVVAMTWFHHSLGRWRKALAGGQDEHTGRFFRLANEVPTVLMIGIVIMVVVRPF